MADTFLVDLAADLQAQGFLVAGATGFAGAFPAFQNPADLDTPMVLLTGTAGPATDQARGIKFPRIQVVVRCTDYLAADTRANNIHAYLRNLGPKLMGSTRVKWVQDVQTPFGIGLDENRAHRIACNYQFDIL